MNQYDIRDGFSFNSWKRLFREFSPKWPDPSRWHYSPLPFHWNTYTDPNLKSKKKKKKKPIPPDPPVPPEPFNPISVGNPYWHAGYRNSNEEMD